MNKSPLFIDFEASCLTGWPIEIGWAEIVDGQVVAESHLIRPEPDWDEAEWDEIAAEMHGITLEELRRDGLPARVVAERATTVFEGRLLVSDAADADAAWLARLMEAHPCVREWQVTDVVVLEDRLSADAFLRLDVLLAENVVFHRAGPDAARLAAGWLLTRASPDASRKNRS